MSFLPVFTKMVELFIIILIGYITARLGVLTRETKAQLTRIILNVAIPGTILASVMTSENIPTGRQMALLLGVAISSFAVLFVLSKIVGFILPVKGARRGAVEFGIMFSNVGFIGYPVTQAIFGNDSMLYTSMFNLPFNLLCYSIGASMIQSQALTAGSDATGAGSSGGNAASEKESLRKILLTPAMISSALALVLALTRFRGPAIIGETCSIIGGITTPGALLVIGMALSELPLKDMFSNVQAYLFTLMSVVITPLLVYIIYKPFTTSDPLLFGETVIMTAMPVATSGTMLSVKYHGDEKFMAQITFLSTLASIVTIPLIATLL